MSEKNQNIISRIVKKWTKPAILMAALATPVPLNMAPETTPHDSYQPEETLSQEEITDYNMSVYSSYLGLGNMPEDTATAKTCETENYQRWSGLDLIKEKGGPMGQELIKFLDQNNIQICITPDAEQPPEPLSTQHRIISITSANQDFPEVVDQVFDEVFDLVEKNYLEAGIKSISGLEYYMRLQSTNFILKAEIARQMEQENAPELVDHLQNQTAGCSLSSLFRLSVYDYKNLEYLPRLYTTQQELSKSACFNYNAAFDNFSGHDLKQTLAAKERDISFLERYFFKKSKTDYIKDRGLLSDSDVLRNHFVWGGYDVERIARNAYLDEQAIFAAEASSLPEYKDKVDPGLLFTQKYLALRPESIIHTMEHGTIDDPVKHDFGRALESIYSQYHNPQFLNRPTELTLREKGCSPSSSFAQYSVIAHNEHFRKRFKQPATILTETVEHLQQHSGLLADITQSYMQDKRLFFCLEGEEELGKSVAGAYTAQTGVIALNKNIEHQNDLADTMVHEIVHYVQDMHGLIYFNENWDIYDHQNATLSIEAAAKSLDLLFVFERELQGIGHEHVANEVTGTHDEAIYRAIKETYHVERELDTPHKEAMRIAGEAGFYSFANSQFHTDFYNKRVASFYLKLIDQDKLEYPLQPNPKALYYTQKSGSFAEDFNITADVMRDTVPHFSGQNDKITALFSYIDHYARTRQHADKNKPHKPQLAGNPYSGVDLIAFQEYFKKEHKGDSYLLIKAMEKWQNTASPAVKAKNALKL